MLHADHPTISVILLVIFRFLVSIVLLNVLIGIMATSQNQIMNHGVEAVLLAKANCILNYESVTFRAPCKTKKTIAWKARINPVAPVITSRPPSVQNGSLPTPGNSSASSIDNGRLSTDSRDDGSNV